MADGVGAALRHERLRRNVPLKNIAEQTRISQRFLNAIEREDFEQLPGTLFIRNFVRQYALALDLDPEPLLEQLPKVDTAEGPLPVPSARAASPRWDPRWNSTISLIAWLVLASGAATIAYMHFRRSPPPSLEYSGSDNPKPFERPKSAPIPASTPAAVPVSRLVSHPAPAVPSHPVEVVLTAREPSWVQVTADGKIAFTATLQPNESRTIAADDQVNVLTGNAGGVAISLNGKVLEPLGPVGQVRTVKLTAAGPQLTQKIPPPPPDPL